MALLAWSVITLVVFLQMLDSIDLVPFWQIVALSVSTLLGIGFALYVFYFAKK